MLAPWVFLLPLKAPMASGMIPPGPGVTFPKVEYPIYPYVQDIEPLGTLAIAKRVLTR